MQGDSQLELNLLNLPVKATDSLPNAGRPRINTRMGHGAHGGAGSVAVEAGDYARSV
jgi:hypothetical protein